MNISLSKKLSWLLRHGAENAGLKLSLEGNLYVDEILRLPQFQKYTVAAIRQTVETNDKKRFELSEDPHTRRLRIRAVQGHSIPIDRHGLTPITDANLYPTVVHGTYRRHWESIQLHGLNRMSRTHIHFAPGEPGALGVISGMRQNVEVHIYIDLERALADGFKFYISKNNVILTEGDKMGYLPTKYFKAVIDRPSSIPLDYT